MKRGRWIALTGVTAAGLVAAGVVLSRREGRETARRWAAQYGTPLAGQAKQLASTAVEQYQSQKPKAVEAWNTYAPQAREAIGSFVSQAPQAAGAVIGVFTGDARARG